MNRNIQVRRVDMADARRVAQVIAVAFQPDPVSCWLLPDPDDRLRRHPAFFRVFVDHAIMWGEVHATADYEGVALWLDVEPSEGILSGEDSGLFQEALGPNFPRFMVLDKEMRAVHPLHTRHAFLPFIAVVPERQGQGIGQALLEHMLANLDSAGTPAYLEASTPRSGRLYQRLGFTRMPRDIQLPEGPKLYPMWRPAMPSGSQATQPATMDGAA